MKELYAYVFVLVFGFCLASCSEDQSSGSDSVSPKLTFLEESVEGPRGSDVIVNFTATIPMGIDEISASVGGQSIPFSASGETSVTESITFSIPRNSTLGTEYPVRVSIIDSEGNEKIAETVIIVGPVISAIPNQYTFTRNEESTVSYTGQNERLDQIEEIKEYLKRGDSGEPISAIVLSDAYSNENGDGNGFFSFSSTKQLRNKTFEPDLDIGLMENLFIAAETASHSGAIASNGVAGLIVRENSGNTVLVNEKGHEFTQFIEKGLMGTVMYNQIYNTYFSEARIGPEVENTELRDGKNYTDMEHHWDEAFGYFNAPIDFTSQWPEERKSEDRFWSHYSNVVDPYLNTNSNVMNGFIEGRVAIVNNDPSSVSLMKEEVSKQLEIIAAGTTVHYINQTIAYINEGKVGEAFHSLSEAWAFTNALRYNPNRRISLIQIDEIMTSDYGEDENFWNVTVDGLNNAKNTLATVFPELERVKDNL